MPLKIVRNDITKMTTDAIVNTANEKPVVGEGCDYAVYRAAGFDRLLEYRRENIGFVNEGEAFITPAFRLEAKYIIHAVSPKYIDGESGEEEKLRLCYRNALKLAKDKHLKSVSFPLISTGSYGFPKAKGIRIAADEIYSFLSENEMLIYIVVYDSASTKLGQQMFSSMKNYLSDNYEGSPYPHKHNDNSERNIYPKNSCERNEWGTYSSDCSDNDRRNNCATRRLSSPSLPYEAKGLPFGKKQGIWKKSAINCTTVHEDEIEDTLSEFTPDLENKLGERLKHKSDTFSQYLFYLIEEHGLQNIDVYTDALVTKKVFSKIKNNVDYHPEKITALKLCVGAKLNLDETRDLLARAGYALSPCDMTDMIFSFFIENKIYDLVDLDIQLEEYGLPCIIKED